MKRTLAYWSRKRRRNSEIKELYLEEFAKRVINAIIRQEEIVKLNSELEQKMKEQEDLNTFSGSSVFNILAVFSSSLEMHKNVNSILQHNQLEVFPIFFANFYFLFFKF